LPAAESRAENAQLLEYFIGQRPMSKTSDSSTAAYPDQPVPSAHCIAEASEAAP
jgi:hypothetical protein